MRMAFILIGAAVVAYILIKGFRAVLNERKQPQQPPQITNDKE